MELTIDDKDTSIIKDVSIDPTFYVELPIKGKGGEGRLEQREGREGRRERGGR